MRSREWLIIMVANSPDRLAMLARYKLSYESARDYRRYIESAYMTKQASRGQYYGALDVEKQAHAAYTRQTTAHEIAQ